MLARTIRRCGRPLIETVLIGDLWKQRMAAGASASTAASWFGEWKDKTRNRRLPVDFGSAVVTRCLEHVAAEGSTISAAVLDMILSQEDPSELLIGVRARLEASPSLSAARDDAMCEACLQCLTPAIEALRGTPAHAPLVAVLLHYAAPLLRGPTADGTHPMARPVLQDAIRLAQGAPAHAASLLGPIACAAPQAWIDRVVALVDVAFNGPHYIDTMQLLHVLELTVQRPDLDKTVLHWWRWMQNTDLALNVHALSTVLVVLCRNRVVNDANEVVQQLTAIGAMPSIEGRIAFLGMLSSQPRAPAGQADLLVRQWRGHPDNTEADTCTMLGALLPIYGAIGNRKALIGCCASLLAAPPHLLSPVVCADMVAYLRRVCPPTELQSSRDVIAAAVHAVVARCTAGVDAALLANTTALASEAGLLETVGSWVVGCDVSEEVFGEALEKLVSKQGDGKVLQLAFELCEVSQRAVPDSLRAWGALLEDTAAPTATAAAPTTTAAATSETTATVTDATNAMPA